MSVCVGLFVSVQLGLSETLLSKLDLVFTELLFRLYSSKGISEYFIDLICYNLQQCYHKNAHILKLFQFTSSNEICNITT